MSAPFAFDRAATDALGWTLLHFVWQGALVAAGFAVIDRALSRAGANLRYLVACATLLAMLAIPVGTFVVERDVGPRTQLSLIQSSQSHAPQVSATVTAPAPNRHSAPPALPASVLRASSTALAGWTESARLSALFPWLVISWGLGVLALSIRLLGGWWLVRRLRNSVANVELPEWQGRLQSLSRRIGVSRPVSLFRSALVQVPTALGWLHPVILLPASTLTGLSPSQIEAILAHELAHIRRHDYLVNLLQSLVETLLFYHPAVWWVSRRIREERELCCDDLAVGIAGDAVAYAEALCRLERLRGQSQALVVAASGGSLLVRIARLLGRPSRGPDQGSRGLAVVLGAAAAIALMTSAQNPRAGFGAAAAGVRQATMPLAQLAAATLIAPAVSVIPIAVSIPVLAASVQPVPPSEPNALQAAREESDEPAPPGAETRGSRSQYTIDEWIELSQHGVSPEAVAHYEAAGLKGAPAQDLIALANNGVSPEYVGKIRSGGLEGIGTQDMIRLAQNGVTPEFVSGLSDLGAGNLSTDDLIRLAQNGITPEWYAAMRWMGYPGLTVDRAIRLAQQGISPEFASQLKIVGRHRFSLDELEKMRMQGVTAEYVAQMAGAFNGLGADELIQLRQQGVEPEYVAKMQIIGRFKVQELIALRQQGVTPEFVFEMAAAGYSGLSMQDLIRLQQNGVDGDFVMEAREAGYPQASVSEIIRLRQQGLPCRKDKG